MSILSLDATSDDDQLFSSRPPRRVVCASCGGCGGQDEPYALRYNSGDNLNKERSEGMVTAAAVGSSSVWECTKEAAEVAGRARRPVAFRFNGRVVVVNVGDDPDRVARQWWQDVYGETPEQTWGNDE